MKTIIFFILLLTTLVCVTCITQYSDISQQLLNNADFSSGLEHWQVQKNGSGKVIIQNEELAMHSSDTKTEVSLHQTITNGFIGKKFRVQAQLRSHNIVPGPRPYDRARLLLVQYFGDKADYVLPHQVETLKGTNDWQVGNGVFTISEDCTAVRIVAQIRYCSGDFFIKDLSLYQIEETPLYNKIKWLLRGAWVLFSFLIFVPYLKNQQLAIFSKAFLLVTVTIILVGTTMSAEVKNHLKEQIKDQLMMRNSYESGGHPTTEVYTPSKWQQFVDSKLDITKIAHFTLFAFLLLLLRRTNPSRPVRLVLLDIFMLACATELSQFFIEHRTPLFTDLLIDMAGAGSAFFLTPKKD